MVNNLLENVTKYSLDSGKIDVQIHKAENTYVAASVKDHGIGIDEKHQEKIFFLH